MDQELYIERVSEAAVLPTRAHAGDAGLDLYALESFSLAPQEGRVCRTGIAVALQPGTVGMICDRSSMAKRGVKIAGGIVDAGYRGEIHVVLWNLSQAQVEVQAGDRVAQMLVVPIQTPAPRAVPSLTEVGGPTSRGANGFGSSGR
jgi:dUTP pyrophosphatase